MAAGQSNDFRSRKTSPLAESLVGRGSRTRSRYVPEPLTTVPEPHHSSVPQYLTTSPVKLHLAALEPPPGKALLRR
jgi:hypothetical protein